MVAGILALSFSWEDVVWLWSQKREYIRWRLAWTLRRKEFFCLMGCRICRRVPQGKEEEDGGARLLQISGSDFTQIEQAYDRSQEKLLDMGHLQVLVIGQTLVEDGRWRMVLDYLKQEAFVGEDLYVFEAENAAEILNWQGRIIRRWENIFQGCLRTECQGKYRDGDSQGAFL